MNRTIRMIHNNVRFFFPLFFILFATTLVHSQSQPILHRDTSIHSLKDWLKKGHSQGHVRNYFMATIHQEALKNYWTNATGAALKYETGQFYGLQLGAKGIFTFKTLSADLNELDTLTQKGANWEKELYDIYQPKEGKDLIRLEQLYAKWSVSRSQIQLGRIDVNTSPLLLRRDGRMMPFVYRGIWMEIAEWDKRKLTLGWINGVSPRGATEWYRLREVIGLLNNGFEPDGEKAHYHDKTQTQGMGIVGIQGDIGKGFHLQYWNYLLHQLTDIHWWQLEYKKGAFFLGGQLVHQVPLSYQKKLDYADRYIQPDERATLLSVKAAHQNKNTGVEWSLAYLHAFDNGRFLFPRELGRENFYVSQPRAWVDGFGNMDIYLIRFQHALTVEKWKGFKWSTQWSRINAPGIQEDAFNKYHIAAYWQAMLDVQYAFQQSLKGLELHLLYITKYTADTEALSPTDLFYRTNLHHFNVIANILF